MEPRACSIESIRFSLIVSLGCRKVKLVNVNSLHHYVLPVLQNSAESLSDVEVQALVKSSYIPTYQIEKAVNNPERGVGIRRQIVGQAGNFTPALTDLPYRNYDYSKVSNGPQLGLFCSLSNWEN